MTLNDWLSALGEELGLDDVIMDSDDIHAVLDLARDAAHHIQRPAAPLTAYLVGIAVGRGEPLGPVAAKAAALAVGLGTPDVDPDQN